MFEFQTFLCSCPDIPTSFVEEPVFTPFYAFLTPFQDKERILKAAREKQEVTYKGAPLRLAADFSVETLQDRRECQEMFQGIKSKCL